MEGLLNKEGEVRGVVFKTDRKYIMKHAGEEGLRKVQEELEKLSCSFDYKEEADNMSFYPISMRVFSLVAISKAFDLGKEDIREMGFNAPKFSFLLKFFMRYFTSPEKIMKKAGDMWEEHYTVGTLKAEKGGDENSLRAYLYDVDLHPILCDYLSGYFSSVLAMGVGKEVKCEEVKCIHNGEDHHEFLFKW